MNKIRSLSTFQKGVLTVLAGIVILFTFIYVNIQAEKGIKYRGSFLKQTVSDGNTVYSGTVDAKSVCITVQNDGGITFANSRKKYGPYKVFGGNLSMGSTSEITVLQDDKTVFSGLIQPLEDSFVLFESNGSLHEDMPVIVSGGGTVTDGHGNVIDTDKPSISDIVTISKGLNITRRGNWGLFIIGTILCILTAIWVIFPDELFTLYLSFSVANPADIEPSGFELASRYISWIVMPILLIIIYCLGLGVQ